MVLADLMAKARRAHASACLIVEAGDMEGGMDRIYYAMFHAARALLVQEIGPDVGRMKTHASVIAAFGLVGVRQLGLPAELGRLLNFAEDLRRKADYGDMVFVDRVTVERLLRSSDDFLAAVEARLKLGDTP